MPRREIRSRINKPLTADEKARHTEIRRQVEGEKPRLREAGLRVKREFEARAARLRQAIAALKATREELGLSLADVGERTGIDKANLSRLENASNPNPTVETLTRYADALGKEILITLADKT